MFRSIRRKSASPSGGWRRAARPAITSMKWITSLFPYAPAKMTIVEPNGERSKAQLGLGKSYFRKAGVEHDVLNETATEIVFLEVELKP